MKLRFSRRAHGNLRAISEFYRAENPQAALRVLVAIQRAIELISARPDIGIRSAPDPHIRSKLVTRYPYPIYYRLVDGDLEILHVRHTSRQDWPQS